jgi:hypothetical protein
MAATRDASQSGETPAAQPRYGSIGEDLRSAHRELMREYVALWKYFSTGPADTRLSALVFPYRDLFTRLTSKMQAKRSGRAPMARALVRAYVVKRLGELRTAYQYHMETLSEDDPGVPWLKDVIGALDDLRSSLSKKTPVSTSRGWATAGFSIASAVGITKLVSTQTKHVSLDAFGWEWIGLPALYLVGLIIFMTLVSFYMKRKVLLGSDAVADQPKTAEPLRDGKNVYELEDRLFSLLGFSRSPERQLDVEFWTGMCLLTGVGAELALVFEADRILAIAIAAAFPCAIPIAVLVSVRARKRVWGTRDVASELAAAGTRRGPLGHEPDEPARGNGAQGHES